MKAVLVLELQEGENRQVLPTKLTLLIQEIQECAP